MIVESMFWLEEDLGILVVFIQKMNPTGKIQVVNMPMLARFIPIS
jgi:hypothetical protein